MGHLGLTTLRVLSWYRFEPSTCQISDNLPQPDLPFLLPDSPSPSWRVLSWCRLDLNLCQISDKCLFLFPDSPSPSCKFFLSVDWFYTFPRFLGNVCSCSLILLRLFCEFFLSIDWGYPFVRYLTNGELFECR